MQGKGFVSSDTLKHGQRLGVGGLDCGAAEMQTPITWRQPVRGCLCQGLVVPLPHRGLVRG